MVKAYNSLVSIVNSFEEDEYSFKNRLNQLKLLMMMI